MKDVIQRTCSTDAFIRDKRLDTLDENFLPGQVLWPGTSTVAMVQA